MTAIIDARFDLSSLRTSLPRKQSRIGIGQCSPSITHDVASRVIVVLSGVPMHMWMNQHGACRPACSAGAFTPRSHRYRCACHQPASGRAELHADAWASGVSLDVQRERSCAALWVASPAASLAASPVAFVAATWPCPAHVFVRTHVQTTCLERAMPMAWQTFAGQPAAPRAGPPGHRSHERERGVQVEGKLKGAGTLSRAEPVCTWGWRGTRWLHCRAMEATHAASGLDERRASCAVVRSCALEVAR